MDLGTTGRVSELTCSYAARKPIRISKRSLQRYPSCGFDERLVGDRHELEDDIHAWSETVFAECLWHRQSAKPLCSASSLSRDWNSMSCIPAHHNARWFPRSMHSRVR